MQTQVEYFQAHAVDGDLTPEQMAEMLNLPEGDTTKLFVESSEPDAATGEAKASAGEVKEGTEGAQQAATEPGSEGKTPEAQGEPKGEPPVLLAKDGVHTIPFEKLTQARTEAQTAKQAAEAAQAEAERLRQEIEALKKGTQPPAAGAQAEAGTTETPPGEDVDFGDYSDEKIKEGVAKLVARHVAPLQTEIEALRGKLGEAEAAKALTAREAHYTEIYSAHKDADSIAESAEFAAWKAAQPTFMRAAIEQTLAAGSAKEIVEVFTSYKDATGKTGAAQPGADTKVPDPKAAAAAAQAAIASASAKPPSSLSEVPAAGRTPTDEAQAMLEMSSTSLMSRFEGKSPDEVMRLMAKVL